MRKRSTLPAAALLIASCGGGVNPLTNKEKPLVEHSKYLEELIAVQAAGGGVDARACELAEAIQVVTSSIFTTTEWEQTPPSDRHRAILTEGNNSTLSPIFIPAGSGDLVGGMQCLRYKMNGAVTCALEINRMDPVSYLDIAIVPTTNGGDLEITTSTSLSGDATTRAHSMGSSLRYDYKNDRVDADLYNRDESVHGRYCEPSSAFESRLEARAKEQAAFAARIVGNL